MAEHERLENFARTYRNMVSKSKESWNKLNDYYSSYRTNKKYTPEEVKSIIESNDLEKQIRLSREFFAKDGIYKDLILYYATLLKYAGILIPNPSYGTKLSDSNIKKRYKRVLDYTEELFIPELLTRFSGLTLINGYYYGAIQQISKEGLTVLDLPAEYCRSNFRDYNGNDIIEFNVSYFNTITNKDNRRAALKVYPKVISDYYKAWKDNPTIGSWVMLPTNISLCFSFFENGRPLFLEVIPACIHYEEQVGIERERDLEEIRKIIVQHMPHLTSDGTLVFEPDEAEVMHQGAVNMLSGNKNLSVLTTYADVDSVVSKAGTDSVNNNKLEQSKQNIYTHAGVASEIFAPTGTQALPTSLKYDLSVMMVLGNKYSRFLSYVFNSLYGNSSIQFSYKILPISYYNDSDYITDALKLADKGYSFIVPALALGISQRDLLNLKDLENDMLGLGDKLIPLKSSYTESSDSENPAGRPALNLEDKSPKTLQNEESLNKGGSQ